LLALGGIDGAQHWEDAVWLPVLRLDCKTNPLPTKKISFQTNKEELFVLGWRRIVLFDTDIGRNAPLVFYDMNGGLQQQDAALARSHFSFLKTWQFKLDRQKGFIQCQAVTQDFGTPPKSGPTSVVVTAW
jgi:hypothetical protein